MENVNIQDLRNARSFLDQAADEVLFSVPGPLYEASEELHETYNAIKLALAKVQGLIDNANEGGE